MDSLLRDNSVPLYLQLAEELRGLIRSGELKENEQVMTEKELSEQYGVSRITVRKALDVLTEEELLVRKQGKGTFVTGKRIKRSLNTLMSFTQNCEREGKKPGTKFLTADIIAAHPEDVRLFGLEEDDTVIRIKRLRYADDEPVLIEENHFPRSYAFLLSEDLNGSLYETLHEHGVTAAMGTKSIGICYATKEEASELQVKENEALLYMKDVCFDTENKPIYRGKNIINTDRFSYMLTAYAKE